MREFIGKIGRLCENHVEKIVLAIAAVISIWLFFTGVVFSPDVVKYDNKNVTPGRVDEQVAKKADDLRIAIDRVTNQADEAKYVSRLVGPVGPNDPVLSGLGSRPQPKSLTDLFHSPLGYLASPTTAARSTAVAAAAGAAKYRLPAIPRLTDVAVQCLRAAAYVPQAEITAEHPYANGQTQVDDIDLVTVEARFNIAETFRQFQAFFNGSEVQNESWRDPCLAVPKFAAVQLQRQELLDTGLWSEWTTVPPNRICPYKQLFQVIQNAKDLPVGGIAIRMASYDSVWVTMALLQPDSYQIASADEQWFPPSFYEKFKRIQRQIESDEKKKEREDAKSQAAQAAGGTTTTTPTGRRGETTRGGATTAQGGRGTTTGARSARGEGQTGGDLYGTGAGRGGRATASGRGGNTAAENQPGRGATARGTAARGTRGANDPYQQQGNAYDPMNPANQGPSVSEVEADFLKSQIVPGKTNLASLKDPILIWAIDDTVQPGKMYRYQMRVGVFNPVAGTGHVADRDAARKDQVVLWSDFTPVTSTVPVHKKVYFFAKDVQERTRTASIEVARYLRGYWRTEDFQVQPGETIGKEVETKKEHKEVKKTTTDATGRITNAGSRNNEMLMAGAGNLGLGLGVTQETDDLNPPTIDFSTNALLVDLVAVNDWATGGPTARPRAYYDLLYTEDGTRIEHVAANSRGWPKTLTDAHEEIVANLRKDKKPLRAFGQTGRGAGMENRNSLYGGVRMTP